MTLKPNNITELQRDKFMLKIYKIAWSFAKSMDVRRKFQ